MNDLDVAHPQSGSSSTWFMVMLVFWGVGKTGVPRVESLQAKERTNIKLNPHNYGVVVILSPVQAPLKTYWFCFQFFSTGYLQ